MAATGQRGPNRAGKARAPSMNMEYLAGVKFYAAALVGCTSDFSRSP